MEFADRRRFLQLGHGLAACSLFAPPILLEKAWAQGTEDEDDDPGYDLDMPESPPSDETFSMASLARPPPRFVVNPQYLPPVGTQGSAGSCVSWGVGYGLATYMLAKKNQTDPADPSNQISPAFLYSTVRNALALGCHSAADILHETCNGAKSGHLGGGGTNISMTLAILHKWGVVSAADCPYPKPEIGGHKVVSGALYNNIYNSWAATKAEPSMKIARSHAHKMTWERADSLADLKALLARNEPLAYGTRIPANWKARPFDPGRPWEHYREMATSGGKPAGHCMLIIGYDDEMESVGGSRGAILLQNSWGPNWGMSWSDAFKKHYPNLPEKSSRGYAWITYEAFRVLAGAATKGGTGQIFSIDV